MAKKERKKEEMTTNYHHNLKEKVKKIVESRGMKWNEWVEESSKGRRADFAQKMEESDKVREDFLMDAYQSSKDGMIPYFFVCKHNKHYNGIRITNTHKCRFCDDTLQLYCTACKSTFSDRRVSNHECILEWRTGITPKSTPKPVVIKKK